MHEAEKVLCSKGAAYREALMDVVDCDLAKGQPSPTWPVHSTARQRNTAFLMVMLPDEGTEEQSHPSVS